MARRRGGGRAKQREDAFVKKYDSSLGIAARNQREGNPVAGALAESKNEKMIRALSGAPPAPDPRVNNNRVHIGKHGAPDIYEEKADGRKGMRGKRRPS